METVKTLMRKVGLVDLVHAIMEEYFRHVSSMFGGNESLWCISHSIAAKVERAYLAVLSSEDCEQDAPEGLYFCGLPELRNNRPHLCMHLDCLAGYESNLLQFEGWSDMTDAAFANTPVVVTQLVQDNLRQAMAQLMYGKLVSLDKLEPETIYLLRPEAEADLMRVREAVLYYTQHVVAQERAIISKIV